MIYLSSSLCTFEAAALKRPEVVELNQVFRFFNQYILRRQMPLFPAIFLRVSVVGVCIVHYEIYDAGTLILMATEISISLSGLSNTLTFVTRSIQGVLSSIASSF